jgi:hypothetical protein
MTAQSALADRRAALAKPTSSLWCCRSPAAGRWAGALAYGVLAQLEAFRIHVSPDGDLVECPPMGVGQCKKLNEVFWTRST